MVWAVGPRTVGRLTIVLPHVLARLAVGSRARHSDTNKFKSSSFKPRLQGSEGTLSRDTVVTFACRDRPCQTSDPHCALPRNSNWQGGQWAGDGLALRPVLLLTSSFYQACGCGCACCMLKASLIIRSSL